VGGAAAAFAAVDQQPEAHREFDFMEGDSIVIVTDSDGELQ
jgi:hypothetical protein